MQKKVTSGERNVNLTLLDENYEYMSGHVINEENWIPAIGYLALAWETLGLLHAKTHTELSVVFEDIIFIRAVQFPKEGEVQLTVMVQKGTLLFSFFKTTRIHVIEKFKLQNKI